VKIVEKSEIDGICAHLMCQPRLALDTETTGLDVWGDDRMFSLILADHEQEYYFDFNARSSNPLDKRKSLRSLTSLFEQAGVLWCMHNAKFDLAVLHQEGVRVAGEIHCTEAIGRVAYNQHFAYSLDALVKPLGARKDTRVDDYITEHKLYRMVDGEKQKMFDRVPVEIMARYGAMDARLTHMLAGYQIANIRKQQESVEKGKRGPWDIMLQERAITKVFFEMEKTGISVDLDFVREAYANERSVITEGINAFQSMTGVPFVDSSKTLAPIFDRMGVPYPLTEKGNPSFAKDALEDMNTPLGEKILEIRKAQKRATTYFANFLKFSRDGIIHPNMRQGGTAPGRISYSSPNFQNLPKRTEKVTDKFNTRRSVVPSKGRALVMLDYDQMEYRLMLEYAKQMNVIEQVLGGLDVHEAMAQLMKVHRDSAKTLNFMLLYGGGVATLCAELFSPNIPIAVLQDLMRVKKWGRAALRPDLLSALTREQVDHNMAELEKADALREVYFDRLPGVKAFSDDVIERAKRRGWVKNWAGRICHFPIRALAYKAPNHLIQGGCADVVKKAMLEVARYLDEKKCQTKMILQVHDELVFDAHPQELEIFPVIQTIMQSAYPHRYLPLTVGVEHSWRSLADKVEGFPTRGEAA
jgi:DNA polymerase-1